MPVAVNQRLLVTQHFQHRFVLGFGQLIGVIDPELWLGGFDKQRGVGDIDRAIIGLHSPLIGFAIRKILLHEDHAPAVRRRREYAGVVHQQVRSPLIRRAVDFAPDVKPCSLRNARVKSAPPGNQRCVNRLNAFTHDQTQRSIARGGHQIVAPLSHQADHFVGGGGGFHIDLTAGLLFKLADPVVLLVGLTAFDIPRPGDNIQAPFRFIQRGEWLSRLYGQAGHPQHIKAATGQFFAHQVLLLSQGN